MKDKIILLTGEGDVGTRLDAFVSASGELTRSAAARLVEEGAITVGGKAVAKNYKLRAGDEVEILLPEPTPSEAQPEEIPLDVIYEDGDIIVINKPVGMVVHPAAGNEQGTLVNALLHHCGSSLSGIGGVVRPGIVHRRSWLPPKDRWCPCQCDARYRGAPRLPHRRGCPCNDAAAR